MTTKPTISTPTAILIGSAIVAVGLYFGLQRRPATNDHPSSGSAPSSVAEPSPLQNGSQPEPAGDAPGSAPASAAPSTTLAASNKVVAEQATKALASYRKDILKRCWAPAVAKQPEPSKIKLVYNFSFDASGKQIIRGVREDRETSRPNVRQCIDDLLQPIEIPPPGANVYVEVPLTLP